MTVREKFRPFSAETAGVMENLGVLPVAVVGDLLRHRHGGCQIVYNTVPSGSC
jgi:hypothetical protein